MLDSGGCVRLWGCMLLVVRFPLTLKVKTLEVRFKI